MSIRRDNAYVQDLSSPFVSLHESHAAHSEELGLLRKGPAIESSSSAPDAWTPLQDRIFACSDTISEFRHEEALQFRIVACAGQGGNQASCRCTRDVFGEQIGVEEGSYDADVVCRAGRGQHSSIFLRLDGNSQYPKLAPPLRHRAEVPRFFLTVL